jgi:hypothetical protein
MWRSPWACLAVVGLLLPACGGDSGGTGPSPADIGGVWSWRESVTRGTDLVCRDTGTVTVAQTGSTFSGAGNYSGQCAQAGAPPEEFTLPFSLAEGAVAGSSVSFTVDDCPYEGTVSGDSVLGTVDCVVEIGSRPVHATGTWSLAPAPPAVTATLTYPAGDTLAVPGDVVTIRVHATARRALTWIGYEVSAPVSQRDSAQVLGTTPSTPSISPCLRRARQAS